METHLQTNSEDKLLFEMDNLNSERFNKYITFFIEQAEEGSRVPAKSMLNFLSLFDVAIDKEANADQRKFDQVMNETYAYLHTKDRFIRSEEVSIIDGEKNQFFTIVTLRSITYRLSIDIGDTKFFKSKNNITKLRILNELITSYTLEGKPTRYYRYIIVGFIASRYNILDIKTVEKYIEDESFKKGETSAKYIRYLFDTIQNIFEPKSKNL